MKVETGLHESIAYEQRLYTLCNYNLVEDEFHFVMICPIYENLRSIYMYIYANIGNQGQKR